MRWWYSQNRHPESESFDDYREAIYSTSVNGTMSVFSDGEEWWLHYEH